MRRNLTVYCDRHLLPMGRNVVYVELPSTGPHWREVYQCTVEGCGRNFDSEQGYFHVGAEYRPDPASQVAEVCAKHHGMMYVASAEAKRLLWRCGAEDCDRAEKLACPAFA